MEDRQIVDLFWARSEVAITEAQKEYYAYCLAIAKRLLGDERDAEEVVNDAFLAAWHSIPPQRPEVLSAYLGKLTRRIAIDRIRQRTAKKRGFSETALALEELEEILPSGQDPAAEAELKALEEAIIRFTSSLSESDRLLFLARYWHLRSVSELASETGSREGTVKTRLFRLREKLKKQLKKEGYIE